MNAHEGGCIANAEVSSGQEQCTLERTHTHQGVCGYETNWSRGVRISSDEHDSRLPIRGTMGASAGARKIRTADVAILPTNTIVDCQHEAL
jgi:hypothetical protein